MIRVTQLDGTPILVNPDLVQQVEVTPDTLLVLVNDTRLMVRETPDDLVARIIDYKRATGGDAIARQAAVDRTRAHFAEARS